VVFQTDDQSPQLLKSMYRGKDGVFRPTMPNTVRKIFRSGTEFRNYYTTSPVCSPSRASLLNGQYPRNNNLLTNDGSLGGWLGWKGQAIGENNIPLALKEAGYRTSHFGKFMNSYFDLDTGRPTRQRPRGWGRWFTASFRSGDNLFYGYSVNDDGRIRGPFGRSDYSLKKRVDPPSCGLLTSRARKRPGGPKSRCNYTTDLFTRQAVKEIRSKGNRKPFYMQIDYDAPHGDVRFPVGPQPATRHIGKASRTPLITDPNFDEADISDKPDLVQEAATSRLTAGDRRKLKKAYRSQLESLMAIDESVGAVIRNLRRIGELDNTYIFFLSDHGFFLGEHRFSLAKFLPYESSSSVSMAVRGPGVPEFSSSKEVVGNIDVPATVADLAGIEPSYELDGRSLKRFWRDPSRRSRRPVGIALFNPTATPQLSARAPALRYRGYRVGPYKLIRYWNGESELYDLSRDPYELSNVFGSPAYQVVSQYLTAHYDDVINCVADGCRESLPPWPEPTLP
jgi:arylsulfatase A-like enzyme